MLSTKLKPAIRTKHRGLLSTGVLLLHDIAIHILQTLVKLGFEVLDHPAYSPDLAPSDYNLFGLLKDALRCSHFTSDEEVKEAVHEWLAAQSRTFFFCGHPEACRTLEPSVLKSMGTMLENDIIVRSLLLLK
jgi:histone-lysine N-methyltransferase SETMAR